MQLWHLHAGLLRLPSRPADLPAELPVDGFVWLALDREELQTDFPQLQARLQHWSGDALMDLHVSDLLNAQLPSCFDSTPAYDLMVLRHLVQPGADGDAGQHPATELDTRAIGFVAYSRVLVSVHPADCPVRAYFEERLPQLCTTATGVPHRLPLSSDELLLRMANHMVDHYLEMRRHLSRQHGQLQAALLDEKHAFHGWSRLQAARDTLHRLQDLCEDQQAAVQEWLDALDERRAQLVAQQHDELRVRGRDLLEHIERVLAHVRRLNASTDSAVQMHYAALGHRTNNTMRVLTALTAIFLPLNLITGIFGMNFDGLPLIHSTRGVWIALGFMAFTGLALLLWFRRRRYLSTRS